MNFDLVMMEPSCMKRMNLLLDKDPNTWQQKFMDWSDMSLRDDIVQNVDYYAISIANWNKLMTVFGGAPEIPIFHYYTISTEGTKQTNHDFNPIKL